MKRSHEDHPVNLIKLLPIQPDDPRKRPGLLRTLLTTLVQKLKAAAARVKVRPPVPKAEPMPPSPAPAVRNEPPSVMAPEPVKAIERANAPASPVAAPVAEPERTDMPAAVQMDWTAKFEGWRRAAADAQSAAGAQWRQAWIRADFPRRRAEVHAKVEQVLAAARQWARQTRAYAAQAREDLKRHAAEQSRVLAGAGRALRHSPVPEEPPALQHEVAHVRIQVEALAARLEAMAAQVAALQQQLAQRERAVLDLRQELLQLKIAPAAAASSTAEPAPSVERPKRPRPPKTYGKDAPEPRPGEIRLP